MILMSILTSSHTSRWLDHLAAHDSRMGVRRFRCGAGMPGDMRRYSARRNPRFPANMSVLLMVFSDTVSRRMWTVPSQSIS